MCVWGRGGGAYNLTVAVNSLKATYQLHQQAASSSCSQAFLRDFYNPHNDTDWSRVFWPEDSKEKIKTNRNGEKGMGETKETDK